VVVNVKGVGKLATFRGELTLSIGACLAFTKKASKKLQIDFTKVGKAPGNDS
jgi:hypothetical protein